jgi:uncharacterized phage-associated protein
MRASAVANYLISKSREAQQVPECSRMSPLKLQKILFFAQGWHLGIYGTPLFDEPIYAWRLGPVVEDVYATFRHFGDVNIAMTEWNAGTGSQVKKADDRSFLDRIFAEYATEDAFALVERTHNADPWIDAWANPYSKLISTSAMQRYFGRAV